MVIEIDVDMAQTDEVYASTSYKLFEELGEVPILSQITFDNFVLDEITGAVRHCRKEGGQLLQWPSTLHLFFGRKTDRGRKKGRERDGWGGWPTPV